MKEFEPILNELMLLIAMVVVFIALDITSIISVLVLGVVMLILVHIVKVYGGYFKW
jgi:hypothetical protein